MTLYTAYFRTDTDYAERCRLPNTGQPLGSGQLHYMKQPPSTTLDGRRQLVGATDDGI